MTETGDTLCDPAFPVAIGAISFPKPVLSLAIEPKAKGDEEKISASLAKLASEDKTFTLVNEDIIGDKDKVSVTYKELYKDVEPGTKILIDDGAIELKVDEVVNKDIVCTVVHGNPLGSRKTMNLPGTIIRLPGLAEKDIADLKTACEHDYDYVAISFARNLDDIAQVRKVLDENGGKDIKIITKVENDRSLLEINGNGALKEYASWINQDIKNLEGRELYEKAVLNPIGIKNPIGSITLIRQPLLSNDRGTKTTKDDSIELGNKVVEKTAIIGLETTLDNVRLLKDLFLI